MTVVAYVALDIFFNFYFLGTSHSSRAGLKRTVDRRTTLNS